MTLTNLVKNIGVLDTVEEKEKLNKTQSILNDNKLEAGEKFKQIVAIISSKVDKKEKDLSITSNNKPTQYSEEIRLNCHQQQKLNKFKLNEKKLVMFLNKKCPGFSEWFPFKIFNNEGGNEHVSLGYEKNPNTSSKKNRNEKVKKERVMSNRLKIYKASDFFLLYGEIQSGKASALQVSAFMSLMVGITPIIVLRNFTADLLQMMDGIRKLYAEFDEFCQNTDDIEFLTCERHLIKKNKHRYIDALTGKNPAILIAMANATQIASLNDLIKELGNPVYIPVVDEIDDLCYNSNAGGKHKQIYDQIETLMEHGVSRGGTTATPITTFFEEKKLKPNQVFIMPNPKDYRGFNEITNGIDVRLGNNDIKWLPKTVTSLGKGTQFERDPGMKPYFRLLTTLPPYDRPDYKPSKYTQNTTLSEKAPHPINVLHKTSTFTAHHEEAFNWITSDKDTKKVWSAFIFNGGSHKVYCPQLVGKPTPDSCIWKGIITDGYFKVSETTSIRSIYTTLLNAGATHIACFSGKCANRGVNFTDIDYTISLTHERVMFSKKADTSSLLQSLRLLGRCPTYNYHIPRQLLTHENVYNEMAKTFHLTTDMINASLHDSFKNISNFPTFMSNAMFSSSKIPKRSIAKDKKRCLNPAKNGDKGAGMTEREFKLLLIKRPVISQKILDTIKPDKKEVKLMDKNVTLQQKNDTFISILEKAIQKYDDNTFKSVNEWLKITGLCGFKNKPTHHHAMMSQLVKNNFLERKNNKLRLNT